MPPAQPLTDAQKQTAKDLFMKLDLKRLTSADAKSIMDALEMVGLRGWCESAAGPSALQAKAAAWTNQSRLSSRTTVTPSPPSPPGSARET